MRSKRVLVGILSAVFIVITIVSIFMMFTVKKVTVDFSVFDNADNTLDIQKQFDEYVGENLLFFNIDKLRDVDVGPCYEIESVKKSYPNVIEVKISQRKERFVCEFNDKIYVLSDEGYAMKEISGDYSSRDYVKINLNNVSILDVTLGEKIKTDHDVDVFTAIAFATVDGVVDATKEITVEYVGQTSRSVSFTTHTDVVIRFINSFKYDKSDVAKAFSAYFNSDNDYIKSYNEIVVSKLDDGDIAINWSRG